MTEPTPTSVRVRTRWLGAVLLVMGLFTVSQAVYFNVQDSEQRDCLGEVIADLTGVLDARSATTPRDTLLKKRATAASGYESAASGAIWTVYLKPAKYLKAHPGGEIPPKRGARLQVELIDAILHYGVVSERVEERRDRLIKKAEALDDLREATPIPDFPKGTCD